MHRPRIACQTITFGPDQGSRFPEVLDAVAAAGYDALEAGFRHLQPMPVATLKQLLAERDLHLAASHCGGNLEDPDQADGERRILDRMIATLAELGTELLLYSGLRYESDEQIRRAVDELNRAAETCARHGIRLLYHNHHWEFRDHGGKVMEALEAQRGALGFCPDLGWVYRGGEEVIPFLERVQDRLGGIHFKDFTGPEEGATIVELGEGTAPLAEAAAWLLQHKPDLYWIAEQDATELVPEEAVRRNRAFLEAQIPAEAAANG